MSSSAAQVPDAGRASPGAGGGAGTAAHGIAEVDAGARAGAELEVRRILAVARRHLGVDVALLSRLEADHRVLRHVDADRHPPALQPGRVDPREATLCHHVVAGTIPALLPDATRHPVASPVVAASGLAVATHLGVPVRLPGGEVYGALCCSTSRPAPWLDERDLDSLHMLAALAGEHLARSDDVARNRLHLQQRTMALLGRGGGTDMAYQPVVDLATGRVLAVEALARFPSEDGGPEAVFDEAWRVGLGVELEVAALRSALRALGRLPVGVRLAVNLSPVTLATDDCLSVLDAVPPGQVVVEVTERAFVSDADDIGPARALLRRRGIHLAIDDVGTGFSGLRQILRFEPDTLKLDACMVRDVHTSRAKAVLVDSLATFGRRLGMLVIAEGVETAAEAGALRAAGVPAGQGFHLGRPAPLEALVARPAR